MDDVDLDGNKLCLVISHVFLFISFNCYWLTYLVYLNLQKIAKGKFYQSDLVSHFTFWYEWNNFVFIVYIHACVIFYVFEYVCYVLIFRMAIWPGFIILRSPEKGISWKFWLDPRFPRGPKLKWILKWLPLDRGCFKFYFL